MRKLRQILCCVFALAVLFFSLNGCHTVKGARKDVQEGGKAITEPVE